MVGKTFLGRYEATRLLGEGGMGRVYLADQIDLGRQVVVKVMHDHVALDAKFRDRFQRETLLMARFQHPYVVTLYDASLNDPEGPCIVMEYIPGITMDLLLQRNQRINQARVGRLLGQLCEALQAAHSKGIIHRDLKPGNLMVVDPDTPYEKIKVMDFGLAKLVGASAMLSSTKSTDTGADFAVGTPGYISPEQVRGEDMDHRGDLYSVGVILFELLSGKLPFTGDETMDVLLSHATEAPPTFQEVGASGWVSEPVEKVVMACLEKDPKNRPHSARDLAAMFEKALEQAGTVESAEGAALSETNFDGDTPTFAAQRAEMQTNPHAVIHEMEAWMPEGIASYKLRGFIHDRNGEVVESVPGRIQVRLSQTPTNGNGPLSWFGIGRRNGLIDMELHLNRNNPNQPNKVHITVVMTSADRRTVMSPSWRESCMEVFCDLRAHLVGASVPE